MRRGVGGRWSIKVRWLAMDFVLFCLRVYGFYFYIWFGVFLFFFCGYFMCRYLIGDSDFVEFYIRVRLMFLLDRF